MVGGLKQQEGARGSGQQAVSAVMNYIDFAGSIQNLSTATLSSEVCIKLRFLTKKFLLFQAQEQSVKTERCGLNVSLRAFIDQTS